MPELYGNQFVNSVGGMRLLRRAGTVVPSEWSWSRRAIDHAITRGGM
jgi:hypothetical protein